MASESPMEMNRAAIERLTERLEASRMSRMPVEVGSSAALNDAVKVAGLEIALAIREVGGMIADSLDTLEKQATGGWKPWGKAD